MLARPSKEIIFAPPNQSAKAFLIQAGEVLYDFYQGHGLMMIGDGLNDVVPIFDALPAQAQISMVSNFIVNYICHQKPGTVQPYLIDTSSNSQIPILDKKHKLKLKSDLFASFVTLRYICNTMENEIEVEVDTRSSREVERLKKPKSISLEELRATGRELEIKGQVWEAQDQNKIAQAEKNRKAKNQKFDKATFMQQMAELYKAEKKEKAHKVSHEESIKLISQHTWKDLSEEDLKLLDVDTDFRLHTRTIVADTFNGISIIKNYTLKYCEDMHVWATVIEYIFSSFLTSYPISAHSFVQAPIAENPKVPGLYSAVVSWIEDVTLSYMNINDDYLVTVDFYKLGFLCSSCELFNPTISRLKLFCNFHSTYLKNPTAIATVATEFSSISILKEMKDRKLSFKSLPDRLMAVYYAFEYNIQNNLPFSSGLQFEKIVPYSNHVIKKSCSFCHKSGCEVKRCSKCKVVQYCSVECQKKHWPEHKSVCSLMAEMLTQENLN